MRKAFYLQTGSLANTQSEESEKQAMSDLFAGAIGLFKNPVSHRFSEQKQSEQNKLTDYMIFATIYLLR